MGCSHLSRRTAHGTQHTPVAWPPVLFPLPFDHPVLSFPICAPLPVSVGPRLKVQRAVKEICHPSKPPWGSVRSNCETAIYFRLQFYGPVSSSLHMHVPGPRLLLEVGLSVELVIAQHTVVLLPDPRHAARGGHLSAHVQFVTCQVPHVLLRTQAE